MSSVWMGLGAACAAAVSSLVAVPVAGDAPTTTAEPSAAAAEATDAPPAPKRAWKKGVDDEAAPPPPLLATLAQLHTDERVPLDRASPPQARFDALLADRVTGTSHPLDPRLLELLRKVALRYQSAAGGAPRIELVSGYRSPKLNEILRKKGHHVASHSQHSLGHACDFRVVPAGATKGVEPRVLEKEIRALGWEGGVGTYPTKDDWFVHADVGPKREWVN